MVEIRTQYIHVRIYINSNKKFITGKINIKGTIEVVAHIKCRNSKVING